MKSLLLATTTLLALTVSSPAAVISNLGINPTSATGDFSNSPGGGSFSDQYTFQLVGGPQFFTIASVTNVFPQPSDFITNFNASVFAIVGVIGGGDDILVLGPTAPQPCLSVSNCQFVAGSAFLGAGDYYANISGIGGGTSGYGGNLATRAVPAPIAGASIPSLLAALGLLAFHRRRQRIAA